MRDENDKLHELINTLCRAQEAEALLREVWEKIDPYGRWVVEIPQELSRKLQRYFNFDDSE